PILWTPAITVMCMAGSSHATSSTRSRAPITARRSFELIGIRLSRPILTSLSIPWRPSLAACGLSGVTIRAPCMPPRLRLPWCKTAPGRRCSTTSVVAGLLVMLSAACMGARLLLADELSSYTVEDRRSGYTYLSEDNQRLQDDDFANPGLLWVEQGRALWQRADDTTGMACASCHGDATASM